MRGEYILGDCMEGLRGYEDNHFSLAIVDPPYGIGVNNMSMGTGKKKTTFKGLKNWDNKTPEKQYFTELFRVSKNQIIWGGNYFLDYLGSTNCILIWDKMQEFSGAVFEVAWTNFKSPNKSFKMSRVQAYRNKIHPTQKPIKLYRWLLQNYAKPNDLILDTHVGSASSLIACEMEGFNYVGFEKDADYYEQSTKRIKNHLSQKTLF